MPWAGARGTDARVLAHAPAWGRVARLLVRVPEIACRRCRRTWRLDISAAAQPRGLLARGSIRWALQAVAIDNMAVSRVAARLGVLWDTAKDAVLEAGMRALGEVKTRLKGGRGSWGSMSMCGAAGVASGA
ncbi:hypothetical protein MANAM107_25750 [Actinomyces capricornis]|uniref:ISL3 family transposase n=1 Tax=Actinomyces capricornis TaxID=2755559 RepID=A0ABN6KBM4_9ACTO|nr:hypothetical protein MANAM107_25750 [Actinomyces capricornis]